MIFADRSDAGRQLAATLGDFAGRADAVVLALPRGGVPVASEIATALRLPLDVFVVRKLGVPGQEELAVGAIASGNVCVWNEDVRAHVGLSDEQLAAISNREHIELQRREQLYRGDRPPPTLTGRTIILVDDGLATGASMKAAITALRAHQPAQIIVAVPVAAPATAVEIGQQADRVVCLQTPAWFSAVGESYADFNQTSDEEVQRLLATA